jgi:hypothetical protein
VPACSIVVEFLRGHRVSQGKAAELLDGMRYDLFDRVTLGFATLDSKSGGKWEFILAPGAVTLGQGQVSACTLVLYSLLSVNRTGTSSVLLDLLDDEPFKIALFTPVGEHFVKGHRALGVLALEEALAFPFSLAVVVPRRANVLVRRHEGRSGH